MNTTVLVRRKQVTYSWLHEIQITLQDGGHYLVNFNEIHEILQGFLVHVQINKDLYN